jgi:hypothetical protein
MSFMGFLQGVQLLPNDIDDFLRIEPQLRALHGNLPGVRPQTPDFLRFQQRPPGTVAKTPSLSRFWYARATVLGLMRKSAATWRTEVNASPGCRAPEAM